MRKSLIFLPLVAILLGGCRGTKHYAESEYVKYLPWERTEDYKILQLGDIHMSQSDLHEEHFALIEKTIKASNPDFIALTGDCFTYADKHTVKKLFDFIESHNIYWTYVFGNHDDQGYYSDTYIQRLCASKRYQHCRFVNLEDDDVEGRSNFVINLRKGNDNSKAEYQLYFLDSHNYNFDTGEYDFIKQDQIDWYERMVNYSKDNYGGGAVVKSSMYMHIGFPEFTKIWDQSKSVEEQENAPIIGDMEEWHGSPSADKGIFNKIKELGSTQSVSCSHDHSNDSVIKYEGVYLCYGVHATNRIYNDKEGKKLGGQIIKIDHTDLSLSFKNYYANYADDVVLETPAEGWAK